jgi:acyl carrier protein
MEIRSAIISQFESVAKERNLKLPPLSDDLVLLESGLDSLSFAIIVARLEDSLGIDPFVSTESEFPVTLRDFIGVYLDAAK